MRYHPLGKSGLLVSNLGLGTMIFGEASQRSTPEKDAVRIIHHFLDAGGNHIDTANVYAAGRSEEIVGAAIKDRRDRVVLASKVRFATGKGANDAGLSRFHILRSVEASLRRLQTDTIDLFTMHMWDSLTPLEESLRAFDDLVTAGKVRYIGVSNFKAWQVMKALAVSDAHGWVRFVAAQYQYSLVVRDIEREFTELCLTEGIGITPWGPLGGGFLSGKYKRGAPPAVASEGRLAVTGEGAEEAWSRRATERNWQILDAVAQIAEAHQKSYSQVALAWLCAKPGVASVILGPRTEEHLQDNLGAADWDLTFAELEQLDTVSAIELGYPYRIIHEQGTRQF